MALILAFGPASGGHFNPVVTLADRLLGGVTSRQLVGGAAGIAVVALLYPAVATAADDVVVPRGTP